MSKPQLPEQEATRLDALYKYEILDTLREAVFDDIAQLAAQLSGMPIALINFIDRNRQWFKASIAWTIPELPRHVGSSLLNLQSGYIKDQQAIKSFKESQNRIKSIALIHENLYQVKNLSQINFAEYVQKLG